MNTQDTDKTVRDALSKHPLKLLSIIGKGPYEELVRIVLSLVDSQVAERSLTLPEWIECQSMFADGTATSLSEFIRAYEPVQSTNPDDRAADEWRQALSKALGSSATSMRSACVEKVKEIASDYRKLGKDNANIIAHHLDGVAIQLESVTIQEQEKQP